MSDTLALHYARVRCAAVREVYMQSLGLPCYSQDTAQDVYETEDVFPTHDTVSVSRHYPIVYSSSFSFQKQESSDEEPGVPSRHNQRGKDAHAKPEELDASSLMDPSEAGKKFRKAEKRACIERGVEFPMILTLQAQAGNALASCIRTLHPPRRLDEAPQNLITHLPLAFITSLSGLRVPSHLLIDSPTSRLSW